ncbi:helix-turn-helix domain-containing protein [Vibrio metschnikovii]|nr:helix-turn-helix domain-containing protein [Vibrio metschnikovii]
MAFKSQNLSWLMEKNSFTDLIEYLIADSGYSKLQLAEKAGISRSSLYNLIKGEVGECKLSTLISLAAALKVHPFELIQPFLRQSKPANTRTISTEFIEDVTYPDYSLVIPNQRFTKIWSVLNSGQQAWENLFLTCQDQPINGKENYGLHPVNRAVPIPYTEPNQRASVMVDFIAPSLPCTVMSEWKTTDSNGQLVFPHKSPLYCLVKVCSY